MPIGVRDLLYGEWVITGSWNPTDEEMEAVGELVNDTIETISEDMENFVEEVDAGMAGYEFGGSIWAAFSTGDVWVSCDCGKVLHFSKICFGIATPGVIAGVQFGAVSNVECDPDKYAGWFIESSITTPYGGAGYDIGVNAYGSAASATSGLPDITAPTGVNEAYVSMGAAGASVMMCYYRAR